MKLETAWAVQVLLVGAATVVTSFVGFALKRLFIQRLDEVGSKLEALNNSVHAMSLQNAKDHASVRERIAMLEGKLHE